MFSLKDPFSPFKDGKTNGFTFIIMESAEIRDQILKYIDFLNNSSLSSYEKLEKVYSELKWSKKDLLPEDFNIIIDKIDKVLR